MKVIVHQQISAHVNGGQSGGSSVRRPGGEDPHRRERKLNIVHHPHFDILYTYTTKKNKRTIILWIKENFLIFKL